MSVWLLFPIAQTTVDGAREGPAGKTHAPGSLEEGDEAWDPEHDDEQLLQGARDGEFMCCLRHGFPVLTLVSGYSEVRSKQVVRPGERASFKIKVVSKTPGGNWSVGIVRSASTAGKAWSSIGLKNQVFYLNSAKCNLFNGPLLQYFESEGMDGPYAVDEDFGRTGSGDDTTDKGAWYGKTGWMPPLKYEYNNGKLLKELRQDDVLELDVNLETEEGELHFIVNGKKIPRYCKGIRKALEAAEVLEAADVAAFEAESVIAERLSDSDIGKSLERCDETEIRQGYVFAVQTHSKGKSTGITEHFHFVYLSRNFLGEMQS